MGYFGVDEFVARRNAVGNSSAIEGIRILVNENGLIRTEDRPGNPPFSYDRISDYINNSRNYSPGDKITEFCNFDTHTRYTVRAQDERPFAYVQDELNVPACGYEEPLPEPFKPFNPFGTLVYGPYKEIKYCDWELNEVRVLIEKKNYTGSLTEIPIKGGKPVRKIYSRVDDINTPIRPCEVELAIINSENFQTEEFYTADERTFRVTIFVNDLIDFKGYIIPDNSQEPFNAPNTESLIRCTDALGTLKSATYPVQKGQDFEFKQSFIAVLCFALASTNLNLDIKTICNLYADDMPNGLDDDPLYMAEISPFRLAKDNGELLTCYEVIEEVCKAWGAIFVQDGGAWNMVRGKELSIQPIRQRVYDYTGFRRSTGLVFTQRIAGGSR